MRPDGTAPEGYLEDQGDEHRITKTIFAPHKDLMRQMIYDNNLVQCRVDTLGLRDDNLHRAVDNLHRAVNNFDGSGKSAKDILADYVEALGVHITTEIASKYSGTPINRFQKEVLLVIPNRWRDRLESEILQVGRSSL